MKVKKLNDSFRRLWIVLLLPWRKKVKVKWSRYRPGVAQRVGRGILYSSTTTALEGSEWSAARPGCILHPRKTRYPLYRRLGGPQGRSGRAENLVATGIRSRTVQPVASHYTDWATGPTLPWLGTWKRAYASWIDVFGVLFYVGLIVRVCFSSFWKAGCRYWCPDGTGILYVRSEDSQQICKTGIVVLTQLKLFILVIKQLDAQNLFYNKFI